MAPAAMTPIFVSLGILSVELQSAFHAMAWAAETNFHLTFCGFRSMYGLLQIFWYSADQGGLSLQHDVQPEDCQHLRLV